jgi:hypothetical protein
MDDHHFNYITKKVSLKRPSYGPIIFLFIDSFAYLQLQTQFHLVKRLYFIQSIKYKPIHFKRMYFIQTTMHYIATGGGDLTTQVRHPRKNLVKMLSQQAFFESGGQNMMTHY